jgi:putative transposase|nr:transposase [uncultured Oscillibacter sp.]
MLLRRCQNTRVSLCSASAVVVDLVQEYGKNCVKENKRHPFSQESEVDSQKFSSTTKIMDAMKEMFRDVLQQVMESELDTELGYAKSQRMSDPGVVNKPRNYRNGYSKKTLKTQLGAVDVRAPWDRNGAYEPQIIGKYNRNADGMEEKVLALYSCGMSQRDIAEQNKSLYDVDISPELVTKITEKIMPEVTAWQNRPLEAVYPFVFMDAIP